MVLVVLQGAYLGWQPVPVSQSRMGALVFVGMLAMGILFLGFIFRKNGPGNLWGMVALFGAAAGLAAMWVSRGIRQHREKTSD